MRLVAIIIALIALMLVPIAESSEVQTLGDTAIRYQIIPPEEGEINHKVGFILPESVIATDRDVVISHNNFNKMASKVPESTHQFAKALYVDKRVKFFAISFRDVLVTLYFDARPDEFVLSLEDDFKTWINKVNPPKAE